MSIEYVEHECTSQYTPVNAIVLPSPAYQSSLTLHSHSLTPHPSYSFT